MNYQNHIILDRKISKINSRSGAKLGCGCWIAQREVLRGFEIFLNNSAKNHVILDREISKISSRSGAKLGCGYWIAQREALGGFEISF